MTLDELLGHLACADCDSYVLFRPSQPRFAEIRHRETCPAYRWYRREGRLSELPGIARLTVEVQVPEPDPELPTAPADPGQPEKGGLGDDSA